VGEDLTILKGLDDRRAEASGGAGDEHALDGHIDRRRIRRRSNPGEGWRSNAALRLDCCKRFIE
jgi:hypothetical protein